MVFVGKVRSYPQAKNTVLYFIYIFPILGWENVNDSNGLEYPIAPFVSLTVAFVSLTVAFMSQLCIKKPCNSFYLLQV